jgi:hypothetical protein
MFLEIHQPVRHLQVRHVQQLPGVAERLCIFAMRIDHHDMAIGRHLADAVQDQRGAGRLTGAGRSQQREVLAQQRVDVDTRADVARGEHGADDDAGPAIAGIDLPQVCAGRRIDQRARHRKARHATPEAVKPPGQAFLVAFAQEIDLRDHAAFERRILPLVAHRGQKPRIAHADLHRTADLARKRDGSVVIAHAFLQPRQIDADHATRPRDIGDEADRLARIFVAVRTKIGGLGGRPGFETLHAHFRHHPIPRADHA